MNRFWLFPVALAVFVIAPFALFGDDFTALFSAGGAVAFLEKNPESGWISGIVLLVADLFAPIPTTGVIAALGLVYGPVVGASVALAGSLLAASVGYGIGRTFGRAASVRLFGDAVDGAERLFARRGGWIVAFSRWAPVLPEVVSVVAGVARMPFAAFLAAAACGALPLCAIFALIGHLGREAPVWTLALSAILPILLWFVASRTGAARRLGLTSE